jgi:hypothetical protein
MRNKVILIALLILYGINLSSQVTIGMGEAPIDGALLQLKESKVADDGANATKGFGFPRVQLTDGNNLYPMFYDNSTSGPTSAYQGTGKDALDKTHTGLVVYNTNNASPFQKGLYIWDGSLWTPVGGTSSGTTGGSRWAVTAARTTQPLTDDHKDPVYRPGSVTIGVDDKHTLDAVLNVAATDKGVLLPRVTLTSPTDSKTIPNPTTGLLVYNTGGNSKFRTKGYMFWKGTEWVLVGHIPSVPPEITKLYCDRAQLSPSYFYDNNKASNNQSYFTGILRIPYDGGNGGWHDKSDKLDLSGTPLGAGMVYELQGGQLNNGVGELVFSVKGYPTSNIIKFPTAALIDFYKGTSCTATIESERNADIRSIATMGVLEYTNDENVPGYYRSLTTPDKKFSVRVFCPYGKTIDLSDLQIRYNQTSPNMINIIWSAAYSWKGGSTGASANTLVLPTNAWAGNTKKGLESDNNGTVTDFISARTWDGNAVKGNPDAAWGNADVYYDNAPEQRSYMWTTSDAHDKTFYHLTFMMGAGTAGKVENVYQDTKAFIKIDQIHAED